MRVLLASASERRLTWLNDYFESMEIVCKPLLSEEKGIEKDKSVEKQSIEKFASQKQNLLL